jgi:hypothetical protein
MSESRTLKSSVCVPPGHKPSSKRNTRLFLWFAIPALKLVSLSLGCGPSGGEQNRQCQGSGCARDGVCAHGLVCSDNNVCQPSGRAEPPAPSCSLPFPGNARCAADEFAIWCDPGAEIPVTCAAHYKPAGGDTLLCCAPCNNAPSACESPGVGYACNGAHTPTERDPSLECVSVGVSSGAPTAYCCAPNACFGIEGPDCDAGRPYACTGTATPSDLALACEPRSDAPGHYCCADKDAAPD